MSWLGIEVDGSVCTITLQRTEKLNALSRALRDDLDRALQSNEVRRSRALVLTGAGRAFSAGADLGELGARPPLREQLRPPVHERLAELEIPTVAAISGYCLGGGLELALAADIRVADADAELGFPELELGTLPNWGGILRLVRLVGEARARELVLLGRRLSAQEAERAGLVAEVTAPGRGLARAQELASQLAEMPPEAMLVARRLLAAAHEASFRAGELTQALAGDALAARGDREPSGVPDH